MQPQVTDALNTVNRLIPLVEQAERQFKSARNWNFLDVLGGGAITDLVKHYKLGKAGNTMNEINCYLQQLYEIFEEGNYFSSELKKWHLQYLNQLSVNGLMARFF